MRKQYKINKKENLDFDLSLKIIHTSIFLFILTHSFTYLLIFNYITFYTHDNNMSRYS